MAQKELSSLAVSIFCRNMAMLLSSGIDAEEAVGLLADDAAQNDFHDAAKDVQKRMLSGQPRLSEAMKKSGYFPGHSCAMLSAGEKTGKSEQVLNSLADYYQSRDRLSRKLRAAVTYPIVLLALAAAILVLLLVRVLPVFTSVYRSLAGGLTDSAYAYLTAAYVIGIIALAASLVFMIFLLVCSAQAKTPGGREKLLGLISRFSRTNEAVKKVSLASFTQGLYMFVASGADADTSVSAAEELVEDPGTRKKIDDVRSAMKKQNMGMAKAIYEKKLFEPLYGRLLISAVRSGQTEDMLGKLASQFSEEADETVDSLIDMIEPVISAFLTIAVGIVLLATMIPLIGILGAV